MNEINNKLKAPFANVSWRVSRTSAKKNQQGTYPANTKAQFLAYIDARDVMDRLDEVVGASNWQNTMEIMPNGSMKCKLSIKFGDEWVSKEDGAGTRQIETEKSAYSDALKRSAVLWGIGRYLYNVKTYQNIPINEWGEATKEGKDRLKQILKDAAKGMYDNVIIDEESIYNTKQQKKGALALETNNEPPIFIDKDGFTEQQEAELLILLKSCKGITLQNILNGYKVQTLRQIKESIFETMKARILRTIEKEQK